MLMLQGALVANPFKLPQEQAFPDHKRMPQEQAFADARGCRAKDMV